VRRDQNFRRDKLERCHWENDVETYMERFLSRLDLGTSRSEKSSMAG
jgi:hypothetical protein